MARRVRDMQTPEEQYAATQAAGLRAQADRVDARATAAYGALLRLPDGRTTDAQMAQPRRDRAAAKQLREQADQVEAEAAPKKRGWFS